MDSLYFKLPGSGQYVVDRRSCAFQSDGGNSYSSSNGTRVLKFRINGEGWLDPSTVRKMFDVIITDPDDRKSLKPIRHCHGFFRSVRLSVRGQIIKHIQGLNSVSHMFSLFESRQTL